MSEKKKKQVNKSDLNETWMICERKICIHLIRDSDLAYITEDNLLKISTNLFLSPDNRLV